MPRNSVPFKENMRDNLSRPKRSSYMNSENPMPKRTKAHDEPDSDDNVVTFSYRRKSKNPNGLTIKNVNILFNEDAMKVMNVQATETHLPKQSTRIPTARKLKMPASPKNAARQSTKIPTNERSAQNINSYDHGRDIDEISLASPVSGIDCVRDDDSELRSSLSLLNIIESDNSEKMVGCANFPVTPVSRARSLANYIAEDKLPSIIEDSCVEHNYSARLRSAKKRHRLPLLDSDGYISSDKSAINKRIIRKRKQPIKKRRKRQVNKGVKLRNEAIISDRSVPSSSKSTFLYWFLVNL